MQAQKMSPIWYWVSPIWSDLLRFGQIWSDLVIRVTAYLKQRQVLAEEEEEEELATLPSGIYCKLAQPTRHSWDTSDPRYFGIKTLWH